MKLNWLAVVIAAGLLAACETTPVQDGADTGAQQQVDGAQTDGLQGIGGGTGTELGGAQMDAGVSYDKGAINDPNSVLAERVIYFDYNSDQISSDYQKLIEHHGKYLVHNPDMKLRLEGHADERGSREYNIALGNRRAQAVRKLMQLQGMDAKQLDVISYGEEKPVALSHDEEAWRLNRRVELVYEQK